MNEIAKADPQLIVVLLKINLLSNLLLSTLQATDCNDAIEDSVQKFIYQASQSSYRESLLTKSQDFSAERERLKKISADQSVNMKKETRHLLKQFLDN